LDSTIPASWRATGCELHSSCPLHDQVTLTLGTSNSYPNCTWVFGTLQSDLANFEQKIPRLTIAGVDAVIPKDPMLFNGAPAGFFARRRGTHVFTSAYTKPCSRSLTETGVVTRRRIGRAGRIAKISPCMSLRRINPTSWRGFGL
jgi:hypothetical protein